MKIKLFFLISVLLTISVQSFALEILTMGDSITKGWPYVVYDQYGTRRGVYQPDLEQLLSDYGVPSHVYNWGVGGETTPEGVNRITTVLKSRPANFILIMEGTNDVRNGISSSTTRTNIGIMIDKSLSWSVVPIMATIPPNSEPTHPIFEDRIAYDYNPKLLSLAQEKKVRLADQYKALRPEWPILNSDNIHPNLEGYKRVAQTWFGAIYPAAVVPVWAIRLLLLTH